MYPTTARVGPSWCGEGAASDRTLNTEASTLSTHEAALLATGLHNTNHLRAHDPGPYARKRSVEILEMMNWHRDKAIGTRLSRIASEEN